MHHAQRFKLPAEELLQPHQKYQGKTAKKFRHKLDSDIIELGNPEVPGFRLHKKIGEGGMGVIYLASDNSGKEVALKISPNYPVGHPRAHLNEWFMRECAATLAIAHPNVVNSFGAGSTDEHLYLALELVRGYNVRQLIQEFNGIPWSLSRFLMIDISKGLNAIHEAGIIHRDIKSENILVQVTNDTFDAKIIDFGLCYISGYDEIYAYLSDLEHPYDPKLSPAKGNFGTPEIRAPEFDDPGGNKKRTFDVYSAGMLLYEMVCSKLPFCGVSVTKENQERVYTHMHKNIMPPKPSDTTNGLKIPQMAEEIIMCAIEKDPKNRFQTMEEMGRAIEACD